MPVHVGNINVLHLDVTRMSFFHHLILTRQTQSLGSRLSLLLQTNYERYGTYSTRFHLKKLITIPDSQTNTQEYISQFFTLPDDDDGTTF
jgi:hypothetical protein